MTVTQTSIDAYAEMTEELNRLQSEVWLAILMLEEACISDVAAYMDIERSTVSGRMNYLHENGYIVFTCKKKSHRTNINSDHFRVATEAEIKAFQKAKEADKTIDSKISRAARILVRAKKTKPIHHEPMLFKVN